MTDITYDLPTDYQKFIHLSRYARWNDAEGRRETWEETVDRLITFWRGQFDRKQISDKKLNEIREAILKLEIMPSMRTLMTAGKALERDHVAGYNPVVGSTRIVTKEFGNIPIEEAYALHEEGKGISVLRKGNLISSHGEWSKASFHCYGEQQVNKVTLRLNSNTVKEVVCTGNHRWVTDNSVVSTDDLSKGDRIAFVSDTDKNIDENNLDYQLGIKHGIIYGDGTTTYAQKRVKGYHIRLCGDSVELLKYFEGYPVTYPPSAGGDPVVMMYDDFAKTHSLKELPSFELETREYLIGFVRGWLAADGSVTKNSQVSLCVAEEGKEWLQKYSERLGYVIQRVYKQAGTTNYGKRRANSYVVYFSRSSMHWMDFLCSWKSERFETLHSHWVVKNVEKLSSKETVYCAEVPETNTFVLEGGLLTGNCSYVAVDNQRVFDEILYVLMCGTGVGFSVERQYINKLPEVAEEFHDTDTIITVADSKIGWAKAYRELISLLYNGQVPKWDVSKVRGAGERLKTFGGRASGPGPLVDLFKFTIEVFKNAAGRKLNSLECHDIVCKVADVVVVGGVRRSALISLSNLTDERMRTAKSGEWYINEGQRALANNSVSYTEKPDMGIFMREWQSLYDSKSGERGIFNREAAQNLVPDRRKEYDYKDYGCNPCSEIVLRSKQFCNLTEVVARPDDTLESLERKIELATVLGTMQSSLTNFRYLSSVWRKNTEEEALLGVSITGIMDHAVLSGSTNYWGTAEAGNYLTIKYALEMLKEKAIETNKAWAIKLGVNPSSAITCVKPSGTVSQLVDSASGIHPRYSPYYIRTVRADKKDPLSAMMIDAGFPVEDDVMKPDSGYVFSFPMKAPSHAIFRDDFNAIQQLELWKTYQLHYTEHKPSITVYVKEEEWMAVGAWCYENFDILSGVSFLPHSNHVYKQAPYQEITEEEYNKLLEQMPKDVDWSKLGLYEKEDNTESTKELACTAGACEII